MLQNLQTNQEVLLTILEAFVYDPLVDWASVDHLTTTSGAVSVAVVLAVYGITIIFIEFNASGNDLRMQDAKPVAKKMFAVRKKEYNEPWLANYAHMVDILAALKIILRKIIIEEPTEANLLLLEKQKTDEKRKLQTALSEEQQMMKHFRPLMKALATVCLYSINFYLFFLLVQ